MMWRTSALLLATPGHGESEVRGVSGARARGARASHRIIYQRCDIIILVRHYQTVLPVVINPTFSPLANAVYTLLSRLAIRIAV